MNNRKRPYPLLAGAFVLLLSSCNRGYGCPGSNFSIEDIFSSLIALIA